MKYLFCFLFLVFTGYGMFLVYHLAMKRIEKGHNGASYAATIAIIGAMIGYVISYFTKMIIGGP
jgi:hypothetical protein